MKYRIEGSDLTGKLNINLQKLKKFGVEENETRSHSCNTYDLGIRPCKVLAVDEERNSPREYLPVISR